MLRADWHRCAHVTLAGNRLVKRFVSACDHVASCSGALVHIHGFDRFAAAQCQAFVHNRFEWQLFTAAQLVVGRDDSDCASVNDALLQCLGREATKHHAVRCANAGASLHGDHAFQGHRHVNQHAVAFLDAIGFQRVGKLADAGEQFFVRRLGNFTVVTFKNHRCFVLYWRAHVLVQAVGRSVEFTIVKPFVKRCVGFVQSLGEWLVPHHVFTCQARPKTFKILLGFGA